MKLLLSLILFIFVAFATAHNDCPKSAYLDVPPSDLVQAKDLSAADKVFHEKYMRIAIQVAIDNNAKFAAAIVHKNGTVMCTGVNTGRARIYHGEIEAIVNCTQMYGKKTWEDHYLYTTGEPCVMCSGAIMWSKFDKTIFASYVNNMYCERCFNQLPMDSNEIFKLGYGINHNTQLIGGVLEEITDTFFPSLCGTDNSWGVVPLCSENWRRSCPRSSRYFGY
ncbi:hypothetical protein DICPUDRAFT_58458 [Dictyostelium purpureum]|uniref:CMP/dCMP-type deaminase domain-containing protein n=1 Tax=Dictyostelium purpureum TaxID=5786 RepID=F1A144_DICPU|nr:uncharacterized protein DICPUDRAFT_58458 [Dictyostelium purpureum]EGC30077.1 hypothetical protein DICPUDRAFT_58458 [Dictyostelium purpureum]|eukprot:XP_003293388.1 hypothetical protein DICPUDRAFT_58458 [Dictyostelium purpureum]